MPQSTLPFFGRSYLLTVTPATLVGETVTPSTNRIVISGDEWEPKALRFTFQVEQAAYTNDCVWWYANVDIYNCDGQIDYGPSQGKVLVAELLTEGSQVTIQAGYQADGQPIVIWEGITFQAIWTREEVVDFKLTLRCVMVRGVQNQIKWNIPALTKPAEQMKLIARNSITPVQLNDSQLEMFDGRELVRGKTVYGNPYRYMQAMATDRQLLSWTEHNKFVTAELKDSGKKPLAFAPATLLDRGPIRTPDGTTLSLIGSPQQTEMGINFRVLLDPRLQIVNPLVTVSIDMKYIRQFAISPPPNAGANLVRDLATRYFLVGVRHIGDTRGNAWYSDCVCYSLLSDVSKYIATRSADGKSH
jgi:hypothetical protein